MVSQVPGQYPRVPVSPVPAVPGFIFRHQAACAGSGGGSLGSLAQPGSAWWGSSWPRHTSPLSSADLPSPLTHIHHHPLPNVDGTRTLLNPRLSSRQSHPLAWESRLRPLPRAGPAAATSLPPGRTRPCCSSTWKDPHLPHIPPITASSSTNQALDSARKILSPAPQGTLPLGTFTGARFVIATTSSVSGERAILAGEVSFEVRSEGGGGARELPSPGNSMCQGPKPGEERRGWTEQQVTGPSGRWVGAGATVKRPSVRRGRFMAGLRLPVEAWFLSHRQLTCSVCTA